MYLKIMNSSSKLMCNSSLKNQCVLFVTKCTLLKQKKSIRNRNISLIIRNKIRFLKTVNFVFLKTQKKIIRKL